MEEYWMPKHLDFKNLKLCLDNYHADSLKIRLVGALGGATIVNENLEDRTLGFRKDRIGLHILIDGEKVFYFPLNFYYRGFSLAYERIEPTEDGIGRMVSGTDPYDKKVPEPIRSYLRIDLDNHLMKISFKGRVNLKFHSWREEPYWKYWTIDKPGKLQ